MIRQSAIALGGSLLALVPMLVLPMLVPDAVADPGVADPADIVVIDRPVVDRAGVMGAEGVARAEQALRELRAETRVHMAALLVRTTGGEPIADYAHRQAEAWGGGEAGVDQGVLLVIAIDDRRMRLEVGYGLEGTLTDGTSRRVLDMGKRYLRAGDHAGAVAAMVDGVGKVVQGIELPAARASAGSVRRSRAADSPGAIMRARQLRFALILWLVGCALGAGVYFGLRWRRGRGRGKKWRRKKWRRRAQVWGAALVLSVPVALFAPEGAMLSAYVGILGMTPFGYLLARAPRGSRFGAVFLGLWFMAVAALMHWLLSDEPRALSDWFYLFSPLGMGFALFVSSTVFMTVTTVMLLLSLPIGLIEVKLRRTRLGKSKVVDFCFWFTNSVFRGLWGDPKAEFGSGGGGSSYSSSSSSYSSSYSSSSYSSSSSSSYSSSSGGSGSSGWSGGGGGFGGGGASSSW